MKNKQFLWFAAAILLVAAIAILLFRGERAARPAAIDAGIAVKPPTATNAGPQGITSKATMPNTVASARPALQVAKPTLFHGQPLRTAQLGPLPRLEQPLAAQLSDLQERAKKGDSEAAMALWSGLHQCKDALSDQRVGQLKSGDVALAAIESQALDNCKDVPSDLMNNQYQWLKVAASLGNPQAQYLFAETGADVVGGEMTALQNPEQWQQYQDTAMSYLNNLAEQCNPTAINLLWYGYGKGIQIMAPDLSKSYTYYLVANKLNPSGSASIQAKISSMASQLGSNQAADAEQTADQFYNQNCAN
jgi:hypothetical protein